MSEEQHLLLAVDVESSAKIRRQTDYTFHTVEFLCDTSIYQYSNITPLPTCLSLFARTLDS